jgi:hypothetical protein
MMRRKSALVLLISFLLAVLAWAREDRLNNTGIAPAAEGKVITSTDPNGNTEVEVQVKHLAGADKLTPPRAVYLVWVQARGKDPELLGALKVNDKLEASLKSATPYKEFDILVSAEDSAQATTPSSTVVLKGTVERK